MGALSVVYLLLVAGQGPADVVHLNQRNLQIPITLQPERRNDVQEMRLFASSDQGKTWQQADVKAPDKEAFVFYAPADGLYWFRVALVTRQGKQEPDNIMQGPPDLKMHIDSLKPLLKIVSAQRQGDDVVVTWELQEDHPDWNSLKLEHKPADGSTLIWTAALVTPAPRGEARFRAGSASPLSVRMEIKDQAGNLTQVSADIQGIGGTAVAGGNPPSPQDKRVDAPPPPATPPALVSPPAPANPPPAQQPPAPQPGFPPAGAAIAAAPPAPAPLPQPLGTNTPPTPPSTWPGHPSAAPPAASPRVVASTEDIPPAVTPVGMPGHTSGRKPLPPAQYVNNAEVSVEYELARVGPSGVASVELWWTQDDGKSWEQYAFDDQIKAPVPAGKFQRTLELPGDGLYGFSLVVKSPAGRGRRGPRPGDVPEIRIAVDTIPPVAQLYAPQADTRTHDTLVLSWLAKDQNLTPNPVTLEWAAQREGPWQPIVANLPNTGRHVWRLPETLPVQVFLRLKVRDTAGNEGVAVTSEPQNVDLSEPEGRIVNVTVTPRRP
jgi:hypothetical protein